MCFLQCWGNLYGLQCSNMQHRAINILAFWAPSNSWNFIQLSQNSFRSVLLSLWKTFLSKQHYVTATVRGHTEECKQGRPLYVSIVMAGKKSNPRRKPSVKFWSLTPTWNQNMPSNSRVTINTGQRNNPPKCTVTCVLVAAREKAEHINMSDVMWACACCLAQQIYRNINQLNAIWLILR